MPYADVIAALADPTRRQIFELIRDRPLSVTEIAATQPVSRPAVSQHLKVLERARLVSFEAQGNRRIYRISRKGLEELRRYVESFWTDVLAAYEAEITRRKEEE